MDQVEYSYAKLKLIAVGHIPPGAVVNDQVDPMHGIAPYLSIPDYQATAPNANGPIHHGRGRSNGQLRVIS